MASFFCSCQGRDIGEISKVKVRSSGTGLGAAWHLSHIDVISSVNNTTYHFPFNNWWVREGRSACVHVLFGTLVLAGRHHLQIQHAACVSHYQGLLFLHPTGSTPKMAWSTLFGRMGCRGQVHLWWTTGSPCTLATFGELRFWPIFPIPGA